MTALADRPTNGHAPGIGLPTNQLPPHGAEQHKPPDRDVASESTNNAVAAQPANLDALRQLREHAQQVVQIQDDPDIARAKTDQDLRAEAEQRQQHRADLRAEAESDHQAELARRAERRQRAHTRDAAADKHDDQLTAATQRREQQRAAADTERQRLLDPTDALRRAHQQRRIVPLLMLIPTVAATITSAVNLATQGARLINPSWAGSLLGAGADLVFTCAMLALLAARMVGVDTLATAGEQHKPRLGWFTAGDLAAGLCLVVLNIVAHALPPADGSAHTPGTGWLFAGLVVGFVFSSIFAPLTRRLLDAKFRDACRSAQQHELVTRLDAPSEKLSQEVAVDVRTARYLLELDEKDGLGGQRQADGLPSSNKIYEAMRDRIGRGNHSSARRIRDLMAEMSTEHYPAR